MTYLIISVGAIGGFYGGRMAKAGHMLEAALKIIDERNRLCNK